MCLLNESMLLLDNLVNQKVLTRYLTRVGLNVDVAVHGGECIELFHKHPKEYYCLILCDLFMPVKGKLISNLAGRLV